MIRIILNDAFKPKMFVFVLNMNRIVFYCIYYAGNNVLFKRIIANIC